jgi:hypothetical protein
MTDTPEEIPQYDPTRAARANARGAGRPSPAAFAMTGVQTTACPICGSTDIRPGLVWQEGDRVHHFCSEEHKAEFEKQRATPPAGTGQ